MKHCEYEKATRLFVVHTKRREDEERGEEKRREERR
jgi:hypothetical protein